MLRHILLLWAGWVFDSALQPEATHLWTVVSQSKKTWFLYFTSQNSPEFDILDKLHIVIHPAPIWQRYRLTLGSVPSLLITSSDCYQFPLSDLLFFGKSRNPIYGLILIIPIIGVLKHQQKGNTTLLLVMPHITYLYSWDQNKQHLIPLWYLQTLFIHLSAL